MQRKRTTSTAVERRQKFIRYFRKQTGATEWKMRDVAAMAKKMGWTMPKPEDPLDILARQFSDAAREEMRTDKSTTQRYKAHLAFKKRLPDGKQLWLWFDVDNATRDQMVKGVHLYREQMVSEAEIGANTVDHWNRINPDQARLPFDANLTPDLDERRAAALLEKEPVAS